MMVEDKRDVSKRVERPFLNEKQGLFKKEEVPIEELKEFVLLIMKNNGHTDIIEGVQAGEFFMKSSDGKQEKSSLLTPNKLTTFNYNKQYFRGWVLHEDNMSPYPQEPLHNAEMYRKTTQKLAMNYRDANEAKFMEAKTKMILMIIGGALLAAYVLYVIGKGAGWFGVQGTTETAVQTIKNISQAVNNTGVSVV